MRSCSTRAKFGDAKRLCKTGDSHESHVLGMVASYRQNKASNRMRVKFASIHALYTLFSPWLNFFAGFRVDLALVLEQQEKTIGGGKENWSQCIVVVPTDTRKNTFIIHQFSQKKTSAVNVFLIDACTFIKLQFPSIGSINGSIVAPSSRF